MKLLVRKLWFPHSIDETVTSLFRIPQMQEQFDEDFTYDGEMRPRGIKIYSGYWPADAILDGLPDSEKDVYFVLTSLDLKGDFGRIHGKGYSRRAIASCNSFVYGPRKNRFNPDDVDFNAMAFGEIGHALGLTHHKFNPLNPCEMSHNNRPSLSWSSLEDILFCDNCYQKL